MLDTEKEKHKEKALAKHFDLSLVAIENLTKFNRALQIASEKTINRLNERIQILQKTVDDFQQGFVKLPKAKKETGDIEEKKSEDIPKKKRKEMKLDIFNENEWYVPKGGKVAGSIVSCFLGFVSSNSSEKQNNGHAYRHQISRFYWGVLTGSHEAKEFANSK